MDTTLQEKRNEIIAAINQLPEDKLMEVENVLRNIIASEQHSVADIYNKVKGKYSETLQKLAQ